MKALAAFLLLAAAACSKAPERKAGEAMSERDVAAEARKLRLEPGRWETTTLITDMDVSGLPKGATDAATGTPTITVNCVTPEQAAQPGADFLSGTRDGNCAYQRFSMAGDRIDAAMTCSPRGLPGGNAIAMTLGGGYSPTAFAMNMTMDTKLPGNMAMTMKATVNGKHVGACTGNEASESTAVESMPAPAVPSYDTAAYCRKIGDTAGGSAMIESTCRDMEATARATIEKSAIPVRVQTYCDKIGRTAGGSYQIFQTCAEMERDAASKL